MLIHYLFLVVLSATEEDSTAILFSKIMKNERRRLMCVKQRCIDTGIHNAVITVYVSLF
jgi:hypothetical protein